MQGNANYENILKLLSALHDKLLENADDIDLQDFADEHKNLLDTLLKNPHSDKETFLLIEKIKQLEEILRPVLESESERILNELNRIRSLKHASLKYHTSKNEESRFIDKFK